MRTLAKALDLLLQGKVAAAADVLAQRFRAVEAAQVDGWGVAQHLELIGDARVTSLTDRERTAAARQEKEAIKQRYMVARTRNPGRAGQG